MGSVLLQRTTDPLPLSPREVHLALALTPTTFGLQPPEWSIIYKPPWLWSFVTAAQRDQGPPLTLLPWKRVCVCVLCIGCMCVVYVSVSVVQNKATDSHILQGWALVADQTSRVSSLRALCSRPPLIVMRGILSHPFNNLKYLLHAGRRGRDWRSDTPSWVACGCGPPAGALGSGDRLM